jgi:hypothetical protein
MKFLWVLGLITILFVASQLQSKERELSSAQTAAQDLSASEESLTSAKSISNANSVLTAYKQRSLQNTTAYIPSQCYTKTEDSKGNVHNPCYSCHVNSQSPNYIDDIDLQLSYAFSEVSKNNPWKNLFKDRTQAVAAISDEAIKQYIRQSNYFDKQGNIILNQKLRKLPNGWDFNGNGQWDGMVPDLWYNFDDEGFDRDKAGKDSGWRTFAYYPFPGTFWPTNGSTNDVLIRLPAEMQQNLKGQYDRNVYKVNLAIVEAMIREQDISIDKVNEAALGGVDINKDGKIAMADQVVYDWNPRQNRFMWYVGKAYEMQKAGKLHLAKGLYPEGTEFIHTVRYLDIDEQGDIKLAERIKELRYARKLQWLTYASLRAIADREFKEKHDFPDRTRSVQGNHEIGVSNGQGWMYTGFIEDKNGDLRPQTYEEQVFCVGCHGGIGATRDGIFSFARKFNFNSYQQGWYHWSQKSIKGVKEPLRLDGKHEYGYYLQNNQAGDEFRANTEILDKFFDDGKLKDDKLKVIQNDISKLLWPTEQRAMALNKAYRVIVKEQSFVYGRDATESPLESVYRNVEQERPTGITEPVKNSPLKL